jgi:hypothetical protein
MTSALVHYGTLFTLTGQACDSHLGGHAAQRVQLLKCKPVGQIIRDAQGCGWEIANDYLRLNCTTGNC